MTMEHSVTHDTDRGWYANNILQSCGCSESAVPRGEILASMCRCYHHCSTVDHWIHWIVFSCRVWPLIPLSIQVLFCLGRVTMTADEEKSSRWWQNYHRTTHRVVSSCRYCLHESNATMHSLLVFPKILFCAQGKVRRNRYYRHLAMSVVVVDDDSGK